MTNFTVSSKSNACPRCGRTKDGDCRTSENGNLVHCHTYQIGTKGEVQNGFRFIHHQSKGAGWGLWAKDENESKEFRKANPEPETIFSYKGRDGSPLLQVHRQKGRSPEFWQSYFQNGVWLSAKKVDDAVREKLRARVPLYAYRLVQEAIAEGKPIFFVEGEKVAKKLWELGIAATTTIGGCKGFDSWGDYSDDLKGAKLVICPDRDNPGVHYAEKVEAYFKEHGVEIQGWCYTYPDSPLWREDIIPDKGGLDLYDWVEEGASKADVMAAIEPKRMPKVEELSDVDQASARIRMEVTSFLTETDKAKQVVIRKQACIKNGVSVSEFNEVVASFTNKESEQAGKPRMRSPFEVMNATSEALEFLIDSWLPRKDNAAITGGSGCGKTLLMVDQAYSLITGDRWMGEAVKKSKVMMIVSDQRTPITRSYLINRGFRADDDNWRLIGEGIEDDTKWTVKHLNLLEEWLDEFQPDVVYIDSVVSTIVDPLGLKLESTEIGAWMERVQSLINRYGSCVWIHHDSKSTELTGVNKSSGSWSIVAKPSFHWNLERISKDPTDPNRRLSVCKSRRIEPQQIEIKLNDEDSSFTFVKRVGESPDVTQANMAIQQRIIDMLVNYDDDVWVESSEIKTRVGTESVYTVLSRMVNRGLISMKPQTAPGKRGKLYQLVKSKVKEAAIARSIQPEPINPAIEPTQPDEEFDFEQHGEVVMQPTPVQPEPVKQIVQPEPKKDAKPVCRQSIGVMRQPEAVISGGAKVKVGDRVRCRHVSDWEHGVHGLRVIEIREKGIKLEMRPGNFKPEDLEIWQS